MLGRLTSTQQPGQAELQSSVSRDYRLSAGCNLEAGLQQASHAPGRDYLVFQGTMMASWHHIYVSKNAIKNTGRL